MNFCHTKTGIQNLNMNSLNTFVLIMTQPNKLTNLGSLMYILIQRKQRYL